MFLSRASFIIAASCTQTCIQACGAVRTTPVYPTHHDCSKISAKEMRVAKETRTPSSNIEGRNQVPCAIRFHIYQITFFHFFFSPLRPHYLFTTPFFSPLPRTRTASRPLFTDPLFLPSPCCRHSHTPPAPFFSSFRSRRAAEQLLADKVHLQDLDLPSPSTEGSGKHLGPGSATPLRRNSTCHH